MTTAARRILRFLAAVDHPVTPREIAQNLKLNPNTVRPRLSELRRDGLIIREYRGHYSTTLTYGVTGLPRVQNLQVLASLPVRLEHKGSRGSGFKVAVISLGDLSVMLQFGYQNQQVNYQVSTPRGLDLDGFRAVHVAVGLQLRIMGYEHPLPEDWLVIKYELLNDYGSVLLEGVKSLTWRALDGTLEKYYNKDVGLRREVRPATELPVQDLEHLLQGGMASYQVQQGLAILVKNQQAQAESQKFTNRVIVDLATRMEALTEALYRLIDRGGKADAESKE